MGRMGRKTVGRMMKGGGRGMWERGEEVEDEEGADGLLDGREWRLWKEKDVEGRVGWVV